MGLVCGILVTDNAVSAQTERPGVDKAGEDLAWWRSLTGRLLLCFLTLSADNRRFVVAAPAVYYLWCSRPLMEPKTMILTIEAIYENGVLKPAQPLPLQEHEKVRITIQPATSLARQTAGMVPWTGDAETLERIIRDPEFGILESP